MPSGTNEAENKNLNKIFKLMKLCSRLQKLVTWVNSYLRLYNLIEFIISILVFIHENTIHKVPYTYMKNYTKHLKLKFLKL